MAALSEEQSMIRDQAKSWASEQAPVQKFREMRDSGIEQRFTATTWAEMIEMGWTGILVPEEYGGSELGYLTFGVVLEELGRQLTASPLFASALVGASAIILAGNEEQKQSLLPKVVDGSELLTLALDEGNHHQPARQPPASPGSAEGQQEVAEDEEEEYTVDVRFASASNSFAQLYRAFANLFLLRPIDHYS